MTDMIQINENFVQQIPFLEKSFLDRSTDVFPELRDRLLKFSESLDLNHKERLEEEYFGTGPLADIIEDAEINEIVINDHQDIFYEKAGNWHQLDDHFLSPMTYKNFIQRLCHETGSKIDQQEPFVCVKWGQFRAHITEESISGVPCLCLRRHPNEHWNFKKLLDYDWCSDYQMELLQKCIEERNNILVVGATGSGKTSFMNSCLDYIGVEDRCILLEDTDELYVPNPLSVKLLARLKSSENLPSISLGDLIHQSLRMRPDRLILGEARGAEAKDLLMAMATGHSGSIASLHASNAQEAILRLEMLIQLGAPHWSLEAIRRLILLSIQSIIVVGKENGVRKLQGIWKIVSLEQFGLILQQLDR